MDQNTELIIALFLIAIAVLMQAAAMLGIWLSVRKIHALTVDTKQRVDPLVDSTVEIVSNAREPLRTIIENLVETTKTVRQRTTDVDALVADVVDKSRTHVARMDQVLRDRTTSVDALVVDVVDRSRAQVSHIDQILSDQTANLDSLLTESIERSRAQVQRLDHLVSDLILKVETTSELMQRGALAPINEVSAVVKGVRAGLQFFFSRQRANGTETGGQDEQLFI
jgi:ABC-type transporter Mla subunit MlaD